MYSDGGYLKEKKPKQMNMFLKPDGK